MKSRLATEQTSALFDSLAAPKRRYLLSILADRREPLALETLATEVAVREHRSPIVTDEQVQRTHVELVHNHVPRLLDTGFLTEADDDPRTVALADRSLFDADWVRSLLENPTGGPAWDEQRVTRTLETLQPARRRTICSMLARWPDGLAIADLAAMLVAREAETRVVDVDDADRTSVETRLVHDDIPALEDADLVAYDRASGTVEIDSDAPQWPAEWLATEALVDVVALSRPSRNRSKESGEGAGGRDSPSAGTCRTLEGADAVAARSHEIADSADEELFVTVPDPELVRQRCLERWRAAADRGVDVYVGSQSPCVRDTVAAAVPEATICEPQYDWLNLPLDRFHHGHVVCADRERVLLVTLDESAGESRTTALTGDGPETALVRLVRERIGPRLDRLQARHDDPDEESTSLSL